MSKDKTPKKTNDYESLRAQLAQQRLSSREVVRIMQEAGKLKSQEEADEILSIAKTKLGNDIGIPPHPHHHHHHGEPEADLVADGGFRGYGKNHKDDKLDSEKGPNKPKGESNKLDENKPN
ncbi:MAG: hypothetical protein J6Y53_05260 [Alphaproteobacteria bacterium]|nr:hypothetical protein [Alphaproteobacteria bacterium]